MNATNLELEHKTTIARIDFMADRSQQTPNNQSNMTGSEILNIFVTVGISQLVIDLLSNYLVYKGESYQRVVRRMESAHSKLQRAEIDFKKNETKHQKRYDRAKAEYQQAAADVAKKHIPPSVSRNIHNDQHIDSFLRRTRCCCGVISWRGITRFSRVLLLHVILLLSFRS